MLQWLLPHIYIYIYIPIYIHGYIRINVYISAKAKVPNPSGDVLTPHTVMSILCCAGSPAHCITHAMPHFRLPPTSRMSCSSCCLPSKTQRPPHQRLTPSPRPPRTPLRSRTPSSHSAAPPLPRLPPPRDKTRSLPKLLGHGHLTRAGRSVKGPMLGGMSPSGTTSK